MLRWLLIPIVSMVAHADSIDVQIAPDRHATVHEQYSASAAADFQFLSSACARIEKIQLGDGRDLHATGAGPWITVAMQSTESVDLSYSVDLSAARECALPLLMPRHPIDSVMVTIKDAGSGVSNVSAPHLVAHPESKTWSAIFPAVPSHIQFEWDTGNAPIAEPAGPTGLFVWNFWGLVTVLVTWTIAYLFWARRQAS